MLLSFTESQDGRGWKGPLEIILSSLLELRVLVSLWGSVAASW